MYFFINRVYSDSFVLNFINFEFTYTNSYNNNRKIQRYIMYDITNKHATLTGPRQANLVLIAYASSEGSGEPAHPRSLAKTFAARSYQQ